MKIGLVRRGFSPTGGAESYLRRFLVALEAAGHDGVLFGSPEWPADARPAGVEFVPVRGRSPRAFSNALEALHPRERGLCDVLFSLERVAHCDCYRAGDGVHRQWLQQRPLSDRPRWRGVKKVLRELNPKHRQLLALERAMFAPDASGARAVIANSRMVADEIVFHYRYPPDRIRVIYNGLPAGAFAPVPAERRESVRQKLELRADNYAVLFAGSGWERKGLRFAVDALAQLHPRHRAVLLVAGTGNRRGLPATADDRQRVRFLGAVPGPEMPALYAAADVFFLPTLYDPFSNACLEAFAAGLPVLTTHWNGFSEIIDATGEVTGNVVEPIGSKLMEALERWADPARRDEARPTILAAASRYTIEANVQATLDFLTHLPPGPAGF